MEFKFVHLIFKEYFTAEYIAFIHSNGINDRISELYKLMRNKKNVYLLSTAFNFLRDINPEIFSHIIKIFPQIIDNIESIPQSLKLLLKNKISQPNLHEIHLESLILTKPIWNSMIQLFPQRITFVELKYVQVEFDKFYEFLLLNLNLKLEGFSLIGNITHCESVDLIGEVCKKWVNLKTLSFKNVHFKRESTLTVVIKSESLEQIRFQKTNLNEFLERKEILFSLPNLRDIQFSNTKMTG